MENVENTYVAIKFANDFLSVLWEAMPFIVLGAGIAGLLEEFLPQEFISKLLPKSVLPAIMIGALLGLIFPMCECGIVVVMRRLLRKGLPLSCCIAYMLAGPIINVVVILSTWVAFEKHHFESLPAPEFGIRMVELRVGLGFVVAVTTALIVHVLHRKYGNALLTISTAPPVSAPEPARAAEPSGTTSTGVMDAIGTVPKQRFVIRLGNISSTALHDFVDITVFLIVGALLAALARTLYSPAEMEAFSRDQAFLVIPAMMFLAVMMCLCSEADAFVAASFTNMHPSAQLAFLVLGPMLDLKLLMMFTRVFRLRLIVTITSSVIILTFICSMAVYFVW